MKIDEIKCVLYASRITMPFGVMMAIADEKAVYSLMVEDHRSSEPRMNQLQRDMSASITWGRTEPINMLEQELRDYFAGTLKEFKTPLKFCGTPFQQAVWKELCNIPYGETRSYAEIAKAIGNPSACRAIGQANTVNPLWVIVPCHRVINANGTLGGYNGGPSRKQWLLDHEQKRCLGSRVE